MCGRVQSALGPWQSLAAKPTVDLTSERWRHAQDLGCQAPSERARIVRATVDHETSMKAICRYIEVHHEEYGVALFIVPPLLAVLMLVGVVDGLAWLLQ
jgi:hypothetical protein